MWSLLFLILSSPVWANPGSDSASASAMAIMNPNYEFPPESCESVWNQASEEDYLFDFKTDSVITPRGNEGYPNYLNRMRSKNLNRKNCHKTWTVLVYMAATEDLAHYAYADLLEMENHHHHNGPGSSLRTDVLVQLDTNPDQKVRRLHLFQSPIENKSKHLKKDEVSKLIFQEVQSPVISVSERSSLGIARDRLRNFLKWGVQEYPSEHYLVIIWGHGQGWTAIQANAHDKPEPSLPGEGKAGKFGGLGAEDTSDYLDLPAIRLVFKELKEFIGSPIDVFAQDACLMHSVEDNTELSNYIHYICGSEDIESYAGFPYGALLCQLNSGKFDRAPQRAAHDEITHEEPYLVSWMIPQLCQESFDPQKGSQKDLDPDGFSKLTGCSTSTKHLRSTLIPALNHLGNALLEFIQEKEIRWIELKALVQKGPFFLGGTQDLGTFLKGLSELAAKEVKKDQGKASPMTQNLQLAVTKTYDALNYTIVNCVLGEKYPKFDPSKEMGPRGLSIWLPKSDEEVQSRFADFSKSIFYHTSPSQPPSGWKGWMMNIYGIDFQSQ